jgi:ammonia channel protein AmtB
MALMYACVGSRAGLPRETHHRRNLLFNGIFTVISFDGVNTFLPGACNWHKLYVQVAYVYAMSAYTFVGAGVLAKLVPGLRSKATGGQLELADV